MSYISRIHMTLGVMLAVEAGIADHPWSLEELVALLESEGSQRIEQQKETNVGKNEQTGKRAASNAARVLRDPKASKAAKSAAGSALTQRPDRKRR